MLLSLTQFSNVPLFWSKKNNNHRACCGRSWLRGRWTQTACGRGWRTGTKYKHKYKLEMNLQARLGAVLVQTQARRESSLPLVLQEALPLHHQGHRREWHWLYRHGDGDPQAIEDNWRGGKHNLQRINCRSENSKGVYCLQVRGGWTLECLFSVTWLRVDGLHFVSIKTAGEKVENYLQIIPQLIFFKQCIMWRIRPILGQYFELSYVCWP